MEGLYEALFGQGSMVVTAILLLGCVFFVRKWRHRNRRYPPGLPSIPIVGSLPWLPSDTTHLTFTTFAKKYGNIYSINFGKEQAVVLNDYSSIKEALVKQGALFSDRPKYHALQSFNPEQKGIVAGKYDDTFIHNKQTSLSILRELGLGKNVMEERILAEVEVLIEAFSEKCHHPFDPSELLYVSVSNIICAVLFNKRFPYDDDQFSTALRMMRDMMKDFGELQLFMNIPILCWLPWVQRAVRTYEEKQSRVVLFIEGELEVFFQSNSTDRQENAFISSYIHKMGDRIDLGALKMIVFGFFIAGTDTTSTTLRWALLYMANHPDVQSRVQQEIDDVIGAGRQPSMSDRQSLRYVEAVLLETLRMSSIAPLALPHRLVEGTKLEGFFLKKGSVVYTNLWAVHRDINTWPDPDKFDPSRFLDDDGEVTGKERIIPFGLGRRSCLGEGLARQELFLYFTSIMQRFMVSKTPGTEKLPEDGIFGTVLSPKPHKLVLKQR